MILYSTRCPTGQHIPIIHVLPCLRQYAMMLYLNSCALSTVLAVAKLQSISTTACPCGLVQASCDIGFRVSTMT